MIIMYNVLCAKTQGKIISISPETSEDFIATVAEKATRLVLLQLSENNFWKNNTMFRSKDGLITIEIVRDISEAVFSNTDFSILNVPFESGKTRKMFRSLYNSPTTKHLSMVLCRHQRKNRLAALANYDNLPLKYLDTVNLTYEKATSCSNNGFLPMSEGTIRSRLQ